MTAIITLLYGLQSCQNHRERQTLAKIMIALLCVTGRITGTSLVRVLEGEMSRRTLQRWMQGGHDWASLLWGVARYRLNAKGVCLLAGDDVVVAKSGKVTHGLGRFYSSIAQRPIAGLSFLALALVDVETRQSYPLQIEQRLPKSKAEPTPVGEAPKCGRGRPKGSKNHERAAPLLSPDLLQLQRMVTAVLQRIAGLQVEHLALDGFFGNWPTAYAVRQTGLHLISKFRHDVALYLPFTGEKPKRGPTPRYGDKLNPAALPPDALIDSHIEGEICTQIYQLTARHKEFDDPINVVFIVKTDSRTAKRAHVILFSTDLSLSAETLIDYYSLRFQIEFNFRDAKQHWGLDDFMNITETAVTNAVNLSFLMVNVSAVLMHPYRQHDPDFSVIDLKAHYRARRYLTDVLKILPLPPSSDLVSALWQRWVRFNGIRAPQSERFVA
jgi:hypothetical protein